MADNLDPKNINARLYNQVSELLSQLEKGGGKVTMRERVAALVAIGRIQTIFMTMRLKEKPDDDTRGSAVRKYSTAFTAHDTRRRKAIARSVAAEEPDTTVDDLLGDDEPDADDRDLA